MTPVLECALANAALAAPLAVLAGAATLFRRPAVCHALWLLVLLRLFAPPFWRVPLPAWSAGGTPGPVTASADVVTADAVPASAAADVGFHQLPPQVAAEPAAPPPAPREALDRSAPSTASGAAVWTTLVAGVWLAGTAGCLGLAVVRAVAFRRLLRHADPAPAAWQRTCDRLARRLGLRHRPGVWLVRGQVSPLLWAGFGRPRLVLPAGLAGQLDGVRRAALLAHELAHLRRGDHLIRWLELGATAAFWWYPVVWWARRGLRVAEEQCCDAWVVWALPAARRAYADALVDTVDFLSCARPTPVPLASGLGEVRQLRRRVVMIMRGGVPHRLSRFGLGVGLTAGLALLSVAPSWGQDEEQRRQPEPRPKAERRDDEPRPERQRAEEAEHLRRAIREMREHLMTAERRLAELEGRPVPARPAGEAGPGGFGRGGARGGAPVPPAPPEPPEPPDRPNRLRRPAAEPPAPPAPPAAPAAPAPPAAPRAGGRGGMGGGMAIGGGGDNPERRMRTLEDQLAELRREIAELRREMRRPELREPRPNGN
ncbi:MAG TPA: M56 family metallopeptidase [Gemmataceae bacterium]|jgi:beta-lactamase regulating signal transducer with metallopeptidase domain